MNIYPFEMFQNFLKAHELEDEQIISANLEDGDFKEIRSSKELYEYVEKRLLKGKKN